MLPEGFPFHQFIITTEPNSLAVRYGYEVSLFIESTRILMAGTEKEITACENFIRVNSLIFMFV